MELGLGLTPDARKNKSYRGPQHIDQRRNKHYRQADGDLKARIASVLYWCIDTKPRLGFGHNRHRIKPIYWENRLHLAIMVQHINHYSAKRC